MFDSAETARRRRGLTGAAMAGLALALLGPLPGTQCGVGDGPLVPVRRKAPASRRRNTGRRHAARGVGHTEHGRDDTKYQSDWTLPHPPGNPGS